MYRRRVLLVLVSFLALSLPAFLHPGSALAGKEGESFIEAVLSVSYPEGRDLRGRRAEAAFVGKEIARMAARLAPEIGDGSDPARTVSALNRLLFSKEGFTYDPAPGNPDNYLPDRVLSRKRGNCLGLTVVYLALAERLDIPLRGVYVPSHCFARYEGNGARINIEPAENGTERSDDRYRRDFGLGENRPYLMSLAAPEMVGVYMKSLGAAYSRMGLETEALRIYREASLRYPGLPDAWFNAGVSYQKTGRLDDAIDQYRRALSLDPELAAARDNLGAALAAKGLYREALEEARRAAALAPSNVATRGNLAATLCACGETEEGIREYRRILAVDPRNARALAGLATAHYERGEYEEAILHCDRAIEAGCRLDPGMVSALDKRRSPFAAPVR